MIKNKFGVIQECPNCFSRDLHILKNEELLSKIGNSEFTDIIKCKCGDYFTIEFFKGGRNQK